MSKAKAIVVFISFVGAANVYSIILQAQRFHNIAEVASCKW